MVRDVQKYIITAVGGNLGYPSAKNPSLLTIQANK